MGKLIFILQNLNYKILQRKGKHWGHTLEVVKIPRILFQPHSIIDIHQVKHFQDYELRTSVKYRATMG